MAVPEQLRNSGREATRKRGFRSRRCARGWRPRRSSCRARSNPVSAASFGWRRTAWRNRTRVAAQDRRRACQHGPNRDSRGSRGWQRDRRLADASLSATWPAASRINRGGPLKRAPGRARGGPADRRRPRGRTPRCARSRAPKPRQRTRPPPPATPELGPGKHQAAPYPISPPRRRDRRARRRRRAERAS